MPGLGRVASPRKNAGNRGVRGRRDESVRIWWLADADGLYVVSGNRNTACCTVWDTCRGTSQVPLPLDGWTILGAGREGGWLPESDSTFKCLQLRETASS
jgi:hypothetical protein